jgi:Mg-chelatase subunit ChlD
MGSAVVGFVRTRSARVLSLVVAAVVAFAVVARRAPRVRDRWTPVTLAIVVDVSDSMNGGDKLSRAIAAADHLVDELGDRDRFAIVLCSTRARTLVPLTAATGDARARAHAALAALTGDGGTDLSDSLVLGASLVAREDGARRVVLISDGEPTEGERDPAALAAITARIASRGVDVSTIDVVTP